MRHSRWEKRRIVAMFTRFVEKNPPKMPSEFTNKEYKRVVDYARIAFICGYHTAENDDARPWRLEEPDALITAARLRRIEKARKPDGGTRLPKGQ